MWFWIGFITGWIFNIALLWTINYFYNIKPKKKGSLIIGGEELLDEPQDITIYMS